MKKRVFRLTILFVLALVLVLTISLPALAAKPDGKSVLNNAINKGGGRLLALQGPGTGLIPYNWEWTVGDNDFTSANLQGITATGLLAAYEKTKNKAYLNAAKNSGDTLKARYAADPTQRPYPSDVEFLVRLYQDTKDKSYLDTAKNWYKVVTVDFTAEANVVRLIALRGGSMAGWDIAAQIRAAAATGFKDYARDMAYAVINHSSEWVHVPSYGWDYTSLSYGSLLWAFHDIGGDVLFRSTIKYYQDYLLANQGDDGSWDSDYQNTAYIILGLDAVKGWGKGTRDALSDAVDYLTDTQADNGGWVYEGYGEYPEVDSECVMALQSVAEPSYFPHPWHGVFGHSFFGRHGPGH
jgi:hypothetical protein